MIDTEVHLRGIADGNHAAFTALYRGWQPILVRYATGLLNGDREAAADVVDEALLAVWQQAGRFSGAGSSAGWLRRIVRNKAVDWLRRQRDVSLPSDELESAANSLPDPAKNPHELAAQQSDKSAVIEALQTLSFDHREAIWLCYFEELSVQEIAEIAGCPANTVKTRLFHARRILRESNLLKQTRASDEELFD